MCSSLVEHIHISEDAVVIDSDKDVFEKMSFDNGLGDID